MNIDLTKPFTTQDVLNLLASEDDTHDTQLRVTEAGIAYLSRTIGTVDQEGHAFMLEIFGRGNQYTGPTVASDPAYVEKIERNLRIRWEDPSARWDPFLV